MLGEGSVGKTSLMNRYVNDTFNPNHVSTVRASNATKNLNIQGRHVQLNIFDTAGQEQYHALSPIYYRNADGAVIVFDQTNFESLRRVEQWLQEVQLNSRKQIQIVIVGNKKDLVQSKSQEASKVSNLIQQMIEKNNCSIIHDVNQLKKVNGICYIEASAKSGLNVDLIYLTLTQLMSQNQTNLSSGQFNTKGVRIESQTLQIKNNKDEQDLQMQNKNKCC